MDLVVEDILGMLFGFIGDAWVVKGAFCTSISYPCMVKRMSMDYLRFVSTHGIDHIFPRSGDFVVFSRVGHCVLCSVLLYVSFQY